TLSSPPPLTRVRSPPAYSALYPPQEQKMLPGPALGCRVSGSNPLPKTGILEESATRRAGKKSMFTFVEKPKLGPNPDLLDLGQSADSRHPSKSSSRPSKTPLIPLYSGNLMENEVSQKELEISKHQPYQLQSSLFILSPSKGPTTSSPFPGAIGALPLTHSSRAGPGAPTEVLLASPCRLLPPRAKGGFQAPRPSYSTRNAGIEPQVWKPSFYYK
ncbi:PREDICTED: synaptopodin, partial [Fulmarus glacialis]|uniref:synaptopodin n=1 Tax=Fulmarus glacialis TaxID=30455 RepID=UPI00051C3BAF